MKNGDLALVSAIRKVDDADVALICAMGGDERGNIYPAPLAVMIEGNPFDTFEDPTANLEDEACVQNARPAAHLSAQQIALHQLAVVAQSYANGERPPDERLDPDVAVAMSTLAAELSARGSTIKT